jgi:hypothetical protein
VSLINVALQYESLSPKNVMRIRPQCYPEKSGFVKDKRQNSNETQPEKQPTQLAYNPVQTATKFRGRQGDKPAS